MTEAERQRWNDANRAFLATEPDEPDELEDDSDMLDVDDIDDEMTVGGTDTLKEWQMPF